MDKLDFQAGEILLVDKPLEWTSFDVVNKLRYELKRKLGVKKFKVGHAGTLDPLATGLLVICCGKKTKEIEGFISEEKEYTGKFLLGKTTPSYDLETEFNSEKSIDGITENDLQEACKKLTGEIQQTPPIFSAKKINGKKAYDLARAGEEVVLKKAPVTINAFEIDTSNLPEVAFRIACSKGTYIRSMAFDFGELLGCGATLIELRRTRSGQFDIQKSHSVEGWIEIIQNN
jgi:tRNA pseudouridine55 synthase